MTPTILYGRGFYIFSIFICMKIVITENQYNRLFNEEQLYHGSPYLYDKLDAEKVGSVNDVNEPLGIFFTDTQDVAKFYSNETGTGLGNVLNMLGLGGLKGYKPSVYVGDINPKNPKIVDFGGKISSDEMDKNKIIKKGFKDGHDAIILKNIVDGPSLIQNVTVVKDPSIVKSFKRL